MERFPVAPKKRRAIEFSIRIVDLVMYAVVFFGGIYAMFYPPKSVLQELSGWLWLLPFWAGFLLLGGLIGFIGRASTIWLLEPSADIAAATGILIYAVVLGRSAFDTVTSTVAFCLVLVAFLGICRRYMELQLFGSDPEHEGIRAWFSDAWTRRIPNVPPRG